MWIRKIPILSIIFSNLIIVFGVHGSNQNLTDDEKYANLPPIFKMDNFDNCMLHSPAKILYCTVTIYLHPLENSSSQVWQTIDRLRLNPKNYRHDWLRHGICLHETCPKIDKDLDRSDPIIAQHLQICYDDMYESQGLKTEVVKYFCQGHQSPYEIDRYDIAAGIFLTFYVIFIIIVTLYDLLCTNDDNQSRSSITKILSLLSLKKSWETLTITTTSQNRDMENFKLIHGVRFFNMVLVINAHTVLIQAGMPIINTQAFEKGTDDPARMLFFNGAFIIQTYFVLSAWFLAYNVLVKFHEKHKEFHLVHVLFIILYRALRLLPAILVILTLQSTWFRHLSRGPFSDVMMGREYKNCRKLWWTHLLFINNYYDKENMCLQQTWFIAADTQVQIVGLLLMVVILKVPRFWKSILITSTFLAMMLKFAVSYIRDYDIVTRFYAENIYNFMLFQSNWHALYSSGYGNISGHIIGLFFGYSYYISRHHKMEVTNKVLRLTWWTFVLIPPLVMIFIAYLFYLPEYEHNRILASLYWASSSTVFAFSAGLGIFGGVKWKLGGILRWACLWEPLQVLGKLTYCAYLTHFGLIQFRVAYMRSPNYINDFENIHTSFGDVTLAYLSGTILYLFVEAPMSQLLQLIKKSE